MSTRYAEVRLAPTQTIAPWHLRIPAAGMPFLTSNAARRNTWHANNRLTAQWRHAAGLLARADGGMPRLAAAHIVITAHHRDNRTRDAANLAPTAKAVVDGLVDAGLLPDDDDTHLVGPDLRTGASLGRGRAACPHLIVAVYPMALAAVTASPLHQPVPAQPEQPAPKQRRTTSAPRHRSTR